VLDSVAVHGKRGVSADEPETARDLMAAVSAAGRTVVVADFDALDRVAFAHVCDLRDVDTLAIAASAEDTTAVTEARRLGIEVLTAPARDAS
jgi:DeoR/GlpR family transcriptional regulator of sugar metabolism